MNFSLKCNSLKCRAELKEKAVVTTCSHIFCHDCAESLGLSHPTTSNRSCPACQTVLLNPDDAVSTVLNPTEDYKTSVLSGLDPNTIMECAGRALGFWAYQSTQETFYQEFRAKTLAEKYANLNTQMDNVIHNANTEILSLQNKLSGMQSAQEDLQKKNQELNDLYRDKNNKLSQMTNLYNLLKARAMRSRMQTGVSDTVSQAINSLPSMNAPPFISVARSVMSPVLPKQASRHLQAQSFPVDTEGGEQLHRHQRSGTGSSKRARTKTPKSVPMLPPARPSWNRRSIQDSDHNPQHRTRLPRLSRTPTMVSEFPPSDAIMQRFGK